MNRTATFLVCAAASVRSAAVSLVGVIIAIHLTQSGLTPAAAGLVIGAGVIGGAACTILAGLYSDRWGRRRTLVALGVVTGLGYVGVAVVDGVVALGAIAVVGMVNAMGRDRGPASALEQAMLPALASDERRTWALAWYNATIDAGHAVGALGAAIPTLLVVTAGMHEHDARTMTIVGCGLLLALASLPYLWLGEVAEIKDAGEQGRHAPVDPSTRRTVRKIAGLFAIDSIGGGFLNSALLAYWFFEQFGTTEVQLAALFFVARTLNVVSHVAAAWLARRIGLLNTMVFTHLPSSVFLMLAPFAPTASAAAALFLLREAFVEMDVPTRQSYVMAVVPDSARTYASSMTNVTRNVGWAVGPVLGGPLMQVALAAPLFVGGILKIGYDLALYRSFRHIRPPEEVERAVAAG